MISNELANLADWITGYTSRNEPIPVHAAACLAQTLMDLSERAQQMELIPFRLHSPEVQLPFKQKRKNSDVY